MSSSLPTRRRSASQADVARRAGVSGQTVSRVANGLSNVEEVTRQRVLAAMRELGYRPNKAARSLRSGAFKTIGVTLFTLTSYGNIRTLDAVSTAAAAAGYSITFVTVPHHTQGDVADAFHSLIEQAVDGVILVIEAHLVDAVEVQLPPGLPVLIIDSPPRVDYPVVDNDQDGGARMATQHLLDLGHHTVWHIAGPANSYPSGRREQSWRATLEAADRPVPPVFRGDWTTTAGYQWGLEIAERPEITAVFAASDQIALGLFRALHEKGRQVPRDISVVGFDDMPEAGSFWPPLTTVHQDFEQMGREAINTLIHEIDHGPSTPTITTIPMRLVERESTAQPAVDRGGGHSVDL